jgi:hypothetical protein
LLPKLLKIDVDSCPNNDSIIYNGMCLGCTYFSGLETYQGIPCINCSWFPDDAEDNANDAED